MHYSTLLAPLATFIVLGSALPQGAKIDSTTGKDATSKCGIVGFVSAQGQLQTNVPLASSKRHVPFPVDILECLKYCQTALGDECKTVEWDFITAPRSGCHISQTEFSEHVIPDKHGDHVFYTPECLAPYKDGKHTFPVIAPGQN